MWDVSTLQCLWKLDEMAPYGVRFLSDGRRLLVGATRSPTLVLDVSTAAILARVSSISLSACTPDGRLLASEYEGTVTLWRRRRPEWWWGVFWLPEFWLAALLGAAFIASAVRDARRFVRRRATP